MIETHYDCPCLEKCPLNYAMSIIGGKWKMQIICALNNKGTLRYNELRRKMDKISNTVLAASLRELEEEGLVTRKVYMEVPELTRKMCMELIEFVTVDKCPGKYSKAPREIHIYYKLIDKQPIPEKKYTNNSTCEDC